MRGQHDSQEALYTSVSPASRVPEKHPLRLIKEIVDEELAKLSPIFEKMYSHTGRPSVPPETLLKSTLLMALYSINSERLFCEKLDYDLSFRYFLGMGLEEESFDHSSFSTNRQRLISQNVAERFFEAVVKRIKGSGFLSDEHFTVDGTLIEAWASMKSFRPKDEDPKGGGASGKNPSVDFHGEKRSNETHQSVTDPEARLLRKGKGKEAKLCHALHTIMENRHGFIVGCNYSLSVGDTETKQALKNFKKLKRLGFKPKTGAADKGYFNHEFVAGLRRMGIKPHVAPKDNTLIAGVDWRTFRHESFRVSQRKRKLIEQAFGWLKTRGQFRKTMLRGLAKNGFLAALKLTAYNLLRYTKLLHSPPKMALA
jgi:transposase